MENQTYIFVFAGNMKEVEEYRYRHRLSQRQVRFARDFRDLSNHHYDPPITMPLIGTFWWRPDAQLVYEVARRHGIIPTPTTIAPLYRPPTAPRP